MHLHIMNIEIYIAHLLLIWDSPKYSTKYKTATKSTIPVQSKTNSNIWYRSTQEALMQHTKRIKYIQHVWVGANLAILPFTGATSLSLQINCWLTLAIYRKILLWKSPDGRRRNISTSLTCWRYSEEEKNYVWLHPQY